MPGRGPALECLVCRQLARLIQLGQVQDAIGCSTTMHADELFLCGTLLSCVSGCRVRRLRGQVLWGVNWYAWRLSVVQSTGTGAALAPEMPKLLLGVLRAVCVAESAHTHNTYNAVQTRHSSLCVAAVLWQRWSLMWLPRRPTLRRTSP